MDQTQTPGYVIRVTALRPRLHTEGFSLCPHKSFHRGTSTEKLQVQIWSTQLHSLSPLHKMTAQSLAQRKSVQLSDLMVTNNS